MVRKSSFTYELSPEQQARLLDILNNGNYRPTHVEHAIAAADGDGFRIVLYKSNKCVVQGKGAEDFVLFTLEPIVLQHAGLGYEDELNPEQAEPHVRVDESGKGDYFGPMVVAAAYVDRDLIGVMREMDVKDSKSITSDNKAIALGRDLRELLGKRMGIVKIGPEAYNRLYAKMRNVNTMLGWAHARAIENILDHVPHCTRAIADQFGSKQQIERALMKKGRKIELTQRHKAESDMAVAAASILARSEFLLALKQLEKTYETGFPKGASAAVLESAAALVEKQGPGVLLKIAKCHFKTTDAVLAECGETRAVLGPEGAVTSRASAVRRAARK